MGNTRRTPTGETIRIVTIRRGRYHLRVTPDSTDGGFVAQCVELPGAIEQVKQGRKPLPTGDRRLHRWWSSWRGVSVDWRIDAWQAL